MKLQIDALDSITGWTVNSPSTIETTTDKRNIAGLNSTSLLIKFNIQDEVKTATKAISPAIDISLYKTLIFSIYSRFKGIDKNYLDTSDFSYTIDIGGGNVFFIPVYSNMTAINLSIEGISEISQIKITASHTISDYIIISEMVAELEELPFDVLEATKETLESFLSTKYGNGVLLGTANTTVGDTEITIDNPSYLERYGVVKIVKAAVNETHQIMANAAGLFELNDNFDGDAIINTLSAANVYLTYPVYISPGQDDIRLPGIALWGIEGEPFLRGSGLESRRDSFTSTNSTERKEGQLIRYSVLVDCEARSQELIDQMVKCVKLLIGNERIWINGRPHDIYYDGSPTEFKPQQGVDYIPKMQYRFSVEVREEKEDRTILPYTSSINIDVDDLTKV